MDSGPCLLARRLLLDAAANASGPAEAAAAAMPSSFCLNLISPHSSKFHIVIYDLLVGLPTVAFVCFLVSNARKSMQRLIQSQSHIMATYYAFLWTVCLLNLLRCVVQMWQTVPSSSAASTDLYNALWLLTRFGLVLLEVSVVVFLSQGYLTSGREALIRTVTVSGAIAFADTLIKAVYIFGFGVQLFLVGVSDESVAAQDTWAKWGFWFFHSLVFALVYLAILALPHTRWRDRLPARPAFYRYVLVLFSLYAGLSFGSFLIAIRVPFGYCMYGLMNFAYYAFYPPLLYMTFLADFFMDTIEMEDVYYEELRDPDDDNHLNW
eukprot:jgi/Chlat1/3883/Chrsp26S04163